MILKRKNIEQCIKINKIIVSIQNYLFHEMIYVLENNVKDRLKKYYF